ncbi:MAG: Nif3-like dinuclear metal center hexameric protein [Gammaproteobacteria bacterium]|nr:Nif3-like dinuclear metal center hexameric protein [Gammaproteobacteria bacterium]
MVRLKELEKYTNTMLEIDRFQDYCPNGLQVEGNNEAHTLISGVTASQALLETAIEQKADVILVHHGFFWKGENPCITGIKKQRLKCLLEANVSLLAYHLPLDAHPVYGNNAQLAKVLGLTAQGNFGPPGSAPIGVFGLLNQPMSADDFSRHLQQQLGRKALHIPAGKQHINTLAWCTGAAQSYIEQAVNIGVDAFVSGEISEQTVHIAREAGVHYYAAGHHATERYGVQALGAHLAEQFQLSHQFVDIHNPV